MDVEKVQRWVMSALLLTTAAVFATGLTVLAAYAEDRNGAKPGLLGIAAVVGLAAVGGVRALNERRILSLWLLAGLIPAAVGWYVIFGPVMPE